MRTRIRGTRGAARPQARALRLYAPPRSAETGAAGAFLSRELAACVDAGKVRAATTTSSHLKPLPAEWFINYGTNAEMRWDAVSGLGLLHPGERFFVRDHTSTPLIDASTWTLGLWGDGLRGSPTQANPFSLSYEQLAGFRRSRCRRSSSAPATAAATLNPAGHAAPGTQWGLGAIGVGNWRGVPLAEVLERAGISRSAVDIMPAGLDPTTSPGPASTTARSAGRSRSPRRSRTPILAYELNGQPLPPDNGYPVRLVVPGWVGVANIKWVGQIQVSREPLYSYWNTTNYILEGAAYPTPILLSTQVVKSAFELASGATLPNQRQVLTGRSWSGLAPIKRVDISTDGGVTWRPARLSWPNLPNAWVRWEYPWTPPGPGNYTLQARATDWAGQTQPATVPFNTLGYLFWAIIKQPVTVAS